MRKALGDLEYHCVAGTLILNPPYDVGIAIVPDLQCPATVGLPAKVDAHCDQAGLDQVAVPRVQAPQSWSQPIYPTVKGINTLAPGDRLDYGKQSRIVGKKCEKTQYWVDFHTCL